LEPILIITTGGTIDKVYFDTLSEFAVGDSMVGDLLAEAKVRRSYDLVSLMRKDSLELTDEDRALIASTIAGHAHQRIMITHGTDTMTQTAAVLQDLTDRTIVLTGSLAPARFARTDAIFNVGMAFAAAQILSPGTYIAMNGEIFDAIRVVKDREQNAFVRC
jgi:L-asparaginase